MIRQIEVKSVLNKKKKRDGWFLDDYTLNPYEGCSFNCQYCYVRGSKYGENMEETLAAKTNVLQVLDRQLAFRVKKNQYGMVALASATDPYMGVEGRLKLTRGSLELILKHRFPVLIITKSELVLRDLDILKEIDQAAIHASDLSRRLMRGTIISFSISTLDAKISAALEPGAPGPTARLEAMKKCKEAGLMVGVNAIPILPFISDSEQQINLLVKTAKEYGADYILIGGLTLFGDKPADSKVLYYKFLERNFPDLIPAYLKLYGNFYSPYPNYLKSLENKAIRACEKFGIRNTILAS